KPEPDTCFALLFLRRSNLVSDLSERLHGKLQDSEVRLRSGGVSGDDLNKRNAKPPDASKPADEGIGAIPKLKRDGNRGSKAAAPPSGSPPPSRQEEADADRLSNELVNASPERQEDLIDKLRDAKVVVHTQALATAIPN